MDEHQRAMKLIDEARALERHGRREEARELYEEAAVLEQKAADVAGIDAPRTRGILRVSAVSAWQLARVPDRAVALARRYLSEELSPGFSEELEALLGEIERVQTADVPREPEERRQELLRELRAIEERPERVRLGRARFKPPLELPSGA